jgi:predicted nucleotidyltransferase
MQETTRLGWRSFACSTRTNFDAVFAARLLWYTDIMTKQEIQRQLREMLRTSPVRGRVRRIALFGSQLHGDAGRDSDIDLLIEFSGPVSLLDLVDMELELRERLGRNVDLRTPRSLSKYFRDEVLAEAESLYEA